MHLPLTSTFRGGLFILITLSSSIYSCTQEKTSAEKEKANISVIDTSLMRFEETIQRFEVMDRDSFPPKNAMLFVGSSSFRYWDSLAKDFDPHVVINRGFGGSTMAELNYYADRIVFPYEPSKIFIYEGDNDIVEDSVSPSLVKEQLIEFVEKATHLLPETDLYFVSIKPSPSRKHLLTKAMNTNELIQNYAASEPKLHYIDIFGPMMKDSNNINWELFKEDSLHMNREGYVLWAEVINDVLTTNNE